MVTERKRGRPVDPNSARQKKLAARAERGGQRLGRVESALEQSIVTRHEIPYAERAALRSQARAVDTAEAAGDPEAVSRTNAVYLDLRKAAGLSVDGSKASDAWDDLLAEIQRPTPGHSNTAEQ